MQIGTYIGIPGLGASPSPGPLPPELTLDDSSGLADYAATFTKGGSAVALADVDTVITDPSEDGIDQLVVTGSGIVDGADEVISIGADTFPSNADKSTTEVIGATTFAIAFVTSTKTFTVTKSGGGAMPVADLQTFIESMTYENTSGAPTTGARTFTFQVTDGGQSSNSAVSTITVAASSLMYAGDEISVSAHAVWLPYQWYAAYSGDIVDVTRDSDSATASFGLVNGVLDTDAIVTWSQGSTVHVDKLYDQSGNGNHLTSAGSGDYNVLVRDGELVKDPWGNFEWENPPASSNLANLALPVGYDQNDLTLAYLFYFRGIGPADYNIVLQIAASDGNNSRCAVLCGEGTPQIHVGDGTLQQFNSQNWNVCMPHIGILDVDSSGYTFSQNLTEKESGTFSPSMGSVEITRVTFPTGTSSDSYGRSKGLVVYPKLSAADRQKLYDGLNQHIQVGPDSLTVGAILPETTRAQKTIRDWHATLSVSDFDVTYEDITWDGTYADTETLADLWLAFENNLGHLWTSDELRHQSKWYVLDDGAGAGMEGTGQLVWHYPQSDGHDWNLWTQAAFYYSILNLPLSGGGQGNPYRGVRALALRGLAPCAQYVSRAVEDYENPSNDSTNPDIMGKNGMPLAPLLYYCGSEMSLEARNAAKDIMKLWLMRVRAAPVTTVTGNLVVGFIESIGYLLKAFPTDTNLDALCQDAFRKLVFGKFDGTPSDMASPRYWRVLINEGNGLEWGYGGRSYYLLATLWAFVHDLAAWSDVKTVLDVMTEARTYAMLPYGPNNEMIVVGQNTRTSNEDENGQMSRHALVASESTVGRPQLPTLPAAATMVTDIQSAIASVNTTDNSKAVRTIGGWGGSSADHSAAAQNKGVTTTWADETPFFPPDDWYDPLKALQDATDSTTVLPHRLAASHSKRTPDSALGEMWSGRIHDDGAGHEIDLWMEAQDAASHPFQYNGWAGGQFGICVDTWPVLWSFHGKSGGSSSGDTADEDSVRWHNLDILPFFGAYCAFKAPIESVGSVGANIIELDGDLTDIFVAGKSYIVTETLDAVTRGTFTASAVSYNSGSGKTEVTLSSTSGVSVSDFLCQMFTTARMVDTATPTWDMTGSDVNAVTITGTMTSGSEAMQGNGALPSGQVTWTAVATKLSDGYEWDCTVAADATAQGNSIAQLFLKLPVFLRNPAVEGNDATIEYANALSEWEVLHDTPVSTQYLRITHGSDRSYVHFSTSQTISASTEIYIQPNGPGMRSRSVNVDLHGAPDTPQNWTASENVVFEVNATAPVGISGEAPGATLNSPTSLHNDVIEGWAIAANWSYFGVTDPVNDMFVEVSDDGGSTWTQATGTLKVSGGIAEFVGDDQSTGLWPAGCNRIRIKIVDGATYYSNERALVSSSATTVHNDDYTDTNGTTLSAHTVTPGPDGSLDLGDGTVEIQSNRLEAPASATTYQYEVDSGSGNRQAAIEMVTNPGNASGTVLNVYGWWPALKCRTGSHDRYACPAITATPDQLSWLRSNVDATVGPMGVVSLGSPPDMDTDFTIKAWQNGDMCVAQVFNSGGTYIGGIMLTSVDNSASKTDVGAYGRAGGSSSPTLDELKIWTF